VNRAPISVPTLVSSGAGTHPHRHEEQPMADKNQGIIDPPIDELLSKVESKYALVIFASKRARQINDYYADLHEGSLFDNVGPLVDSSIDDKPLSVAMHEINEDKLEVKPLAAPAD
jgi:DNA-directed RNA polymerase subunit omega